MEKYASGLPFRPISEFYQKRFGAKVFKIPVSVVDTCPNRMGLKGMQTCVFCDIWGSAAESESFQLSLEEQITKYREKIQKKYKATKFLVYFQAYTNTFTKVTKLAENFEIALNSPDVHGLVIGTRPDCLSPTVLELWQRTHERSFVGVELGVQSFFDSHLQFLRRGHSVKQSLQAIDKIASATQVDLGIHLMFGLPNETDQQIIETARLCNELPIQNVKLHNLHVLTNTPLEKIYREGQLEICDRPLYSEKVSLFLSHLSPRLYVHRLAAFSPRWDELVAPAWTSDKMGTHQYIIDVLNKNSIFQGKNYSQGSSFK